MMEMRKILMAFMVISLLIICAGCGASPYEAYVAAVEKTDEIDKTAYEAEITSKADIDTEGLSTREKRQYNFFKNLRVNIEGKRDREAGQIEQVIRYNLNGIGFDITYYQDRESRLLKMPFLDKYILIEQTEGLIDEETYLVPDQETIDKWEVLWLDIIEEDKVFKAEKDLVETPEGEVKATKYIVEIKGQALKTFAIKSIDVLLGDEDFVRSIEEEVNSHLEEDETFDLKGYLEVAKDKINLIGIEKLVFENYVSIDGYIIKDTFKANLSLEALDKRMKGIDLNYEGILFDINREQDIDIPVINQENLTTIKEFQETFPVKIDGLKK
jgi:hypothetical protein